MSDDERRKMQRQKSVYKGAKVLIYILCMIVVCYKEVPGTCLHCV